MFDPSFIESNEYIFGEIFENEFQLPPNIYYCKIDYVWQFLQNAKSINNKFVLITHNGDYSVNSDMSKFIESIPNLKMWFGQNINCINSRITSLPIGLENTKNWTKFSKKDLLYSSNKNITPEKLIYANFSLYTNPSERLSCYELVRNSSFITDKCANQVTQEYYQNWIEDVCDHHYVLCPRGNGIDTHRLWETLYLGRIPITTRNFNTKFYENLPILLVDNWSEITEELLNDKLEFFSNKSNFDLDLLKMSYWRNEILSK